LCSPSRSYLWYCRENVTATISNNNSSTGSSLQYRDRYSIATAKATTTAVPVACYSIATARATTTARHFFRHFVDRYNNSDSVATATAIATATGT